MKFAVVCLTLMALAAFSAVMDQRENRAIYARGISNGQALGLCRAARIVADDRPELATEAQAALAKCARLEAALNQQDPNQ
jgi:hypothetical protein